MLFSSLSYLLIPCLILFDASATPTNLEQVGDGIDRKSWEQQRISSLTLRKRVDVTHGITETFQYYSFAEDAGVNDEETWEIRLRTVQSLLPLGTAAYLMARFYVMAIEAVESYIGRLDDVEEWALRIGEVTLEVFCRNFICFNIIEEFLKKMEQLAGNGLVGMFEGHIVNVATGLTTWVKLSIKAPRPRPD